MDNFTPKEIRVAILAELNESHPKVVNKFNLLGRANLGPGPLEHRLGTTFTNQERAQAARIFDELKAEALISPTYTDLENPEHWVEITDEGLQALKTGAFKTGIVIPQGKYGIPDHVAFSESLDLIFANEVAGKSSDPVTVLFIDLDNFKSVNDTFGHATGDQVMREYIAAIQKVIREKGKLFQRGGDEMLVLLQNFTEAEAYSVAERIRLEIEEHDFTTIGKRAVTASIGVATYPETCPRQEELEDCADKAMYKAKGLGRNKVWSYSISATESEQVGSRTDTNSMEVLMRDSTVFFSERMSDAFPGVRDVQWFNDPEVALERLNILLRLPLKFKYPGGSGFVTPIWWWRGTSNNSIDVFESMSSTKALMSIYELEILKIAAFRGANYYHDFVYVETNPESNLGIESSPNEESIRHQIDNWGYADEEYGLFEGRAISRAEFDDGSAVLDGKVVDLDGKAQLRSRFLSKYNFIIAAYSSPINSNELDSKLEFILNGILKETSNLDDVVREVRRLPKRQLAHQNFD